MNRIIEQKFTRLVVSLGKGREFWCLVLNTVAKLQMKMVEFRPRVLKGSRVSVVAD